MIACFETGFLLKQTPTACGSNMFSQDFEMPALWVWQPTFQVWINYIYKYCCLPATWSGRQPFFLSNIFHSNSFPLTPRPPLFSSPLLTPGTGSWFIQVMPIPGLTRTSKFCTWSFHRPRNISPISPRRHRPTS